MSLAGVSLVTKMFGMPNSSRLRRRALAREVLMSLATRRPSPLRAAPAAVALPPGAAQRSRTLSPGSWGCGMRGSWRLVPGGSRGRIGSRGIWRGGYPRCRSRRF